jgi:endonuclease G, mitochondrial
MKKTSYLFVVFIICLSVFSCKTDITPTPAPTTVKSIHLTLGNPSDANTDENNFLLIKPQYTLSYNKAKAHANWVSWELNNTYLGTADRQNDFRPDPALPIDYYKVTTNDYTNSGFDRGHLCPSADRTASIEDNSATFFMTNIIPQAPELNREAWAYLEDYSRDVVKEGYNAYILAGTYGTGGEGANGDLQKVKNIINVPARVYKIIVLTPQRETVSDKSIVIAVDFPNTVKATKETSWLRFITTPESIEKATNLKLFSALPVAVQTALKAKRFDFMNSPLAIEAVCRLYNGKPLYIGPKGGCYYINSNNNKTYIDRALCGCE